MDAQTLETITHHYLVCALWSSTDDEGEPMAHGRDLDDIAEDTKAQAHEDVADFVGLLEREGVQWSCAMTLEQFGHDFWLTRNGHGAGFWDRGLGGLGDTLTKWAEPYGSIDLYVSDDGQVHA